MRSRLRQETLVERCFRFRGVIFVVSVPLALITIVLFLMPRSTPYDNMHGGGEIDNSFHRKEAGGRGASKKGSGSGGDRYAVIFDCGSTGSRVHVYRFDADLNLQLINGKNELFSQKKPGLSSFKDTPAEAGESLRELLDEAKAAVPQELHKSTPILAGATAGLRFLGAEIADKLLDSVRDIFMQYPFKFDGKDVKILDGSDEGLYAWVTVNYLLRNLGKGYGNTAAVVDLGGGSVQMTYAIAKSAADSAPEKFVYPVVFKGNDYSVYTHSFLGYGLRAARGQVLAKSNGEKGHACIIKGVKGTYKYNDDSYDANARAEGARYEDCAEVVDSALSRDAACPVKPPQCSFAGVWSGGGGSGLLKLYIASYFFDRAAEVGIIPDKNAPTGTAQAGDFGKVGSKICKMTLEEIESNYPGVGKDDAPYICLDIAYCAALLTKGFGIGEKETVTLVKQLEYNGQAVEAQWTLGLAVAAMG